MEQGILERVAAGEQAAVAECLDTYGNLVWSLARRMTSNQADAEDAVQEIFVDLWNNADRYDRSVASEVTFVSMIARRRLIDRLRKKQREPELAELDGAATLPAALAHDDQVEIKSEAARIVRLMATLRPEQQRVIRLSIYHGMSHSSIAQKLGLPLGTVKTHLRRGLLSIRERLESPGGPRAEVTP